MATTQQIARRLKKHPGKDTDLALKHMRWIQKNFPNFYTDYIKPNLRYIVNGDVPGMALPANSVATSGLAGLGDVFTDINTAWATAADPTAAAAIVDTSSNWWDRLVTAIPSTITSVAQGYFQWQAMQTNLQRAKAGLPPINTAAYAPGVNVGLTPQTSNLLMYGALGIGALILVTSLSKSRR
jgi:hypothetical protein